MGVVCYLSKCIVVFILDSSRRPSSISINLAILVNFTPSISVLVYSFLCLILRLFQFRFCFCQSVSAAMSVNKRLRPNTPNTSMESDQQQVFVPPVIIQFTDGQGNFKQPHSTHQFKSFSANLISLIGGEPRKSVIARGGDLFVHPTTEDQQQKLLRLTNCGGRPIKCSLPKSCTNNKGVIVGRPH